MTTTDKDKDDVKVDAPTLPSDDIIVDDDDPIEQDDPTAPVVNPFLPTGPIKPIPDESLD